MSLKHWWCSVAPWHGVHKVQDFPLGNGSWRGKCLVCGCEWAVNPTAGAMLPWSDEFAKFYSGIGFRILKP